ncbi:MAG TPA: tRNA pseudouridine(55) synthase TruB [Porphyromonadaceae bacterium]|jgi:tRNA pseudouridine55 synthase|uniref:tRNA pseudouridine(55) synthase TruB n=1 Tax=Limibacterium fermenti TaxID=3229863 RepID=UPI000E9B4A00|nr:tRNA pseudouridine(55) synthase TruB [Porphyromonadaceae bacterium]HBL33149.1 tRNA pseudouridine(55) synthase TruB [Porphyromonadaceae bacterium]HBX21115.1 tRNA pseudouridine(55) synthase TruB [Porphyromonadaceae bacterium]HBX47168.1 tRNA pseudouridine(55) synthase TruB [Porphyromonadaceae bacterium]HCM22347.1 tRNA pseudouridine(55) synthase TruB [Porphyromonadaceae bacterium]
MDFIEGEILHINKPLHWTSFRVVRVVRAKICSRLKIKKLKVGHTGTLDPLATGVMTICTGRKTKEIDRLQALTKEYVADIRLGATTPSFDLETEVDGTYPTGHITEEAVRECLRRFEGEIQQVPPAFSAVKVEGRRAYTFARNNETIELKPKLLVIESIELLSVDLPTIRVRVVCSKGTYIRALARDIGEALHTGAHLTALTRTRIGEVTLDQCLGMESLELFFDQHIAGQP